MLVSRRHFLSVAAASASVGALPLHLPGQHQGVDDYLKMTNRPVGFDFRKKLWLLYKPGEPYTGTANQNTELLKALKFFDQAPHLTLKQQTVKGGDAVIASLTDKATVESEISRTSFTPANIAAVDLGVLKGPGVYPLRLLGRESRTGLVLFATPSGNGTLSLELVGAASALKIVSPAFLDVPPTEVLTAIQKLFGELADGLLTSSLKRYFTARETAALLNNIKSAGLACVLSPSKIGCGVDGALILSDVALSVVSIATAESSRLDPSEKALLNVWYTVAQTARQGVAFFNDIFQPKRIVCGLIDAGMNVAGAATAEYAQGDVAFVVNMFLTPAGDIVGFICDFTKAK